MTLPIIQRLHIDVRHAMWWSLHPSAALLALYATLAQVLVPTILVGLVLPAAIALRRMHLSWRSLLYQQVDPHRQPPPEWQRFVVFFLGALSTLGTCVMLCAAAQGRTDWPLTATQAAALLVACAIIARTAARDEHEVETLVGDNILQTLAAYLASGPEGGRRHLPPEAPRMLLQIASGRLVIPATDSVALAALRSAGFVTRDDGVCLPTVEGREIVDRALRDAGPPLPHRALV